MGVWWRVNTFDEAAKATVIAAIKRAGNVGNLSVQTNIRVAYLTAYQTGVAVVPEQHLRTIRDYLKRTN
jgi:hypothetical protein